MSPSMSDGCALTDIGFYREDQQDFAACAEFCRTDIPGGRALLAVVCDGMGGLSDGAIASTSAGRAILGQIAALPDLGGDTASLTTALNGAIQVGHHAVLAEGHRRGIRAGKIGTTVVAVYADPRICGMVWSGDSRGYLYRKSSLSLLTHDHTAAQRRADAGLISPSEVADQPDSHVLTAFIGHPDGPRPEVSVFRPQGGDLIILATDGLTGEVDDRAIAHCCDKHAAGLRWSSNDLHLLAKALIERALAGGAPDNATVALLTPPPPPPAEVEQRTQRYEFLEEAQGCLFSTLDLA